MRSGPASARGSASSPDRAARLVPVQRQLALRCSITTRKAGTSRLVELPSPQPVVAAVGYRDVAALAVRNALRLDMKGPPKAASDRADADWP